MRTKIVAGNWKMNKTFEDADTLIYDILDLLEEKGKPGTSTSSFVHRLFTWSWPETLPKIQRFLSGHKMSASLKQGLIRARFRRRCSGPCTSILPSLGIRKEGNISMKMMRSSLPRHEAALKQDIAPIFCCGELLAEREAGKHFETVRQQLEQTIFNLDAEDFARVIIAYEPVWAIGTGVNATSEQAQEMHFYIRDLIWKKYGAEVAADISILYGGSCNAKNAGELFSMPDVDGGLIGGASLKAEEFVQIVLAAKE